MKKLIGFCISIAALLFLTALYSCTKEQQIEKCSRCLLISEKSLSGKLIKKDTLWDATVCGSSLDDVRKQKQDSFFNCQLQMDEHLYYVIK